MGIISLLSIAICVLGIVSAMFINRTFEQNLINKTPMNCMGLALILLVVFQFIMGFVP
jgi:hypothetical protein